MKFRKGVIVDAVIIDLEAVSESCILRITDSVVIDYSTSDVLKYHPGSKRGDSVSVICVGSKNSKFLLTLQNEERLQRIEMRKNFKELELGREISGCINAFHSLGIELAIEGLPHTFLFYKRLRKQLVTSSHALNRKDVEQVFKLGQELDFKVLSKDKRKQNVGLELIVNSKSKTVVDQLNSLLLEKGLFDNTSAKTTKTIELVPKKMRWIDVLFKRRKVVEYNVSVHLIRAAIKATWDENRGIYNLSGLNDALSKRIKGFDYTKMGFGTFKEFCLAQETLFALKMGENGFAEILPKIQISANRKDLKAINLEIDTINCSATSRTQDKSKNSVSKDNKSRKVIPIPRISARKAFEQCEADANGWVDTKEYYQALSKEIKGFNPWVYGGRFNHFYKSLDFLELRVVDKNTKLLKMIVA